MTSHQQPQNVSICATTCFRPDGLQRLLESLATQQFIKNIKPEIRIIVVDNDAEGSAQYVCHDFIARHALKLEYVIEKKRGISTARNRAINIAKDNTNFIAIIDDDEVADIHWLDELMAAQQEFEADIVTGPVIPHFMGPTDQWLKTFFHQSTLPNGQDLLNNYNYVYSGNLLAKAEVLQKFCFDERFGLTGGEDTYLFMKIFEGGYKTVWAEHAIITEWLPENRTNLQWLWQRAYSCGNRFTHCELIHKGGAKIRIQRFIKGMFHCLQGISMALIALGRKPLLVQGIQSICLGIGMVTGSLGMRYQEYKTVRSL